MGQDEVRSPDSKRRGHCARDSRPRWGINTKRKSKRKNDEPDTAEKVLIDEGVSDKREMIIEEEFANLLKCAAQRGNTLTETLRLALDSPDQQQTSNKNTPEASTNAHVTLIGHITKEELATTLQSVDLDNGFGNRILWGGAYKADHCPEQEPIEWRREHPQIIEHLKKAVEIFRLGYPQRIRRDDNAKRVWANIYQELTEKESRGRSSWTRFLNCSSAPG